MRKIIVLFGCFAILGSWLFSAAVNMPSTWETKASNAFWFSEANWDRGIPSGPSAEAIFGYSRVTDIAINGNAELLNMEFYASAPDYTFNLGGNYAFSIHNAIKQNSSSTIVFNTSGTARITFNGTDITGPITIDNNSTAAKAIRFRGNSVLSNSTINNNVGHATEGTISIEDETVISDTLFNNNGNTSRIDLTDTASLVDATLFNNGAKAIFHANANATLVGGNFNNIGEQAQINLGNYINISNATVNNEGERASVTIRGESISENITFTNSGDRSRFYVLDNATIGNLSLENSGDNAQVFVGGKSRLESAEITNSGGNAVITFNGSSIVGNVIFGNVLVSDNGTVDNPDDDIYAEQIVSSSAVNIINSGANAQVIFQDSSRYANGTIVNNGDESVLVFLGNAQVGNASLVNNGTESQLVFNSSIYNAQGYSEGYYGAVGINNTTITSTGVDTLVLMVGNVRSENSSLVLGDGATIRLNRFTYDWLGNYMPTGAIEFDDFTVTNNATIIFDGINFNQAIQVGTENATLDLDLTNVKFVEENASSGTYGIFIKEGAGNLVLGNKHDFTGEIQINGGKAKINTQDNIGTATLGISGANTTVVFDNSTLTNFDLGGLKGDGTFTTNGILFSIGSNNRDTEFSGKIKGADDITKTGDGNLTLSGNGSGYSGNITIAGGDLILSKINFGSAAGAVAFIDASGGNLTLSGATLSNVTRVDVAAGRRLHVSGYATSTVNDVTLADGAALSFAMKKGNASLLKINNNATLGISDFSALRIETSTSSNDKAIREGDSALNIIQTSATNSAFKINGNTITNGTLGRVAGQLDNALVFEISASTSGGSTSIKATAKQESFAQDRFARTKSQKEIARTLDEIFAKKSTEGMELIDLLNHEVAGKDLGDVYSNLGPVALGAMAQSTFLQSRVDLDILEQRWSSYWADRESGLVWRSVDRGIVRVIGGTGSSDASLATYNNSRIRPTSAQKSTDSYGTEKYNPWTPYFGAAMGRTTIDGDPRQGYDIDTTTLYLGADATVGKKSLGGFLFSHGDSKASIENGGWVKNKSYRLAAYGSHHFDNGFVVQTHVALAMQDYDSRRAPYKIGSSKSVSDLDASTNGHMVSFSAAAGKSWYLSVLNNFKLDLLGRLSCDVVTLDAFTESSSYLKTAIEEQKFTNVRSKIQASFGKEIITADGNLWALKARFGWERQLSDQEVPIEGSFLDSAGKPLDGGSFTVHASEVPANVFSVGAFIQMVNLKGVGVGAHFTYEFGSDYKDIRAGLSLGKRF